jgi:predicted SAM-dependent methyltransferase
MQKAKKLLGTAPAKLNCGCGPVVKAGWINIDVGKNADLQLDLREKLPFPDNSVSYIYSEHFFEHLGYPDDAGMFLKESLRVLVPGGQFRVGVPDTEWPLVAYVQDDENYFRFVKETWHPEYCDTKMHHINYHFRQGLEHKYAYDYETLANILRQAGFSKIEKSEFDPELDSKHRKIGTLYVNAFKSI